MQQAGNGIRVTVQLMDSEARQTILAESFDRVLGDIFQLQDEITREVISTLNIKLVANKVDRVVANDPTFSLTSYKNSLPYKEPAMLDRLIGALREAGLPD